MSFNNVILPENVLTVSTKSSKQRLCVMCLFATGLPFQTWVKSQVAQVHIACERRRISGCHWFRQPEIRLRSQAKVHNERSYIYIFFITWLYASVQRNVTYGIHYWLKIELDRTKRDSRHAAYEVEVLCYNGLKVWISVSTKCRLQTGYKMQTSYKMHIAYCRLGKKYRLSIYVMECHFITYLVSRKRHFSQTLALLWASYSLLACLCLKQSSQATVVLK